MDSQTSGERAVLVLKVLLVLVVVGVIVYYAHSLSRHSLHALMVQDHQLAHYIHDHKFISIAIFAGIFTLGSTLTLPIESALCILAGYFFGPVLGVLVAVFSATIGAMANLIIVRKYLGSFFSRFTQSRAVEKVLSTIGRDPFTSVLFLRLVPIFPHFITNFALSLSTVRTRDYTLATALGVLPQLTVFVLAGTQFATIRDTGEVMTPESFGILFLLAFVSLLPVLWKRLFKKEELV